MTATALETVVGAHRPLTRHGLLCLAAGAVCVLSGLGWLPTGGAPVPEMDPWTGTAMGAFIILFMLLTRRWTKQQVRTSSPGTQQAMLGGRWITWLVVLWATLLAGAAWLGRGRMFSGIAVGVLLLIPLGLAMMFPKLAGGRLAPQVSIHPDRIEVEQRGRISSLAWRDVVSAKAFEVVNPQSKLDPDFYGRMSQWLYKHPMLTLVLEGRSGAVVSISLGAFSNQDEMLDAIRRRLEAAGGLPVEVVPA